MMAVTGETPVQDVPYEALKAKLLKLGQKLERVGLTTDLGRRE